VPLSHSAALAAERSIARGTLVDEVVIGCSSRDFASRNQGGDGLEVWLSQWRDRSGFSPDSFARRLHQHHRSL